MQNEQVAAFIELVELDQRLGRLKKQHDDEVAKKSRVIHEIDSIDEKIDRADKNLHDTTKKTHELDLELKVIERNLARTGEKLLRANSQKELDSLEHEKADLESKRATYDEEGLALLDELEQARMHDIMVRKQAPQDRHLKSVELDSLQGQIDKVANALENCTLDRNSLASRSDEELLSRYEEMKKRVHNPAVPVLQESCSGCFYPLSPAEISTIAKGQIGTCKSCYRLLYITKKEHDA